MSKTGNEAKKRNNCMVKETPDPKLTALNPSMAPGVGFEPTRPQGPQT